jgi:hypothetical protein
LLVVQLQQVCMAFSSSSSSSSSLWVQLSLPCLCCILHTCVIIVVVNTSRFWLSLQGVCRCTCEPQLGESSVPSWRKCLRRAADRAHEGVAAAWLACHMLALHQVVDHTEGDTSGRQPAHSQNSASPRTPSLQRRGAVLLLLLQGSAAVAHPSEVETTQDPGSTCKHTSMSIRCPLQSAGFVSSWNSVVFR